MYMYISVVKLSHFVEGVWSACGKYVSRGDQTKIRFGNKIEEIVECSNILYTNYTKTLTIKMTGLVEIELILFIYDTQGKLVE